MGEWWAGQLHGKQVFQMGVDEVPPASLRGWLLANPSKRGKVATIRSRAEAAIKSQVRHEESVLCAMYEREEQSHRKFEAVKCAWGSLEHGKWWSERCSRRCLARS